MIRYSEGGSKETPTKLVGKTDRRGTIVTFKPDPTILMMLISITIQLLLTWMTKLVLPKALLCFEG